MNEWFYAVRELLAEWVVKAKKKCFWLPLLIGLIAGSLLTVFISPTSDLVTGWSGHVGAAIVAVIVTLLIQKSLRIADEINDRKPLNKVLGPIARNVTTIYVAPFARPLESELLRLDRTLPFTETPRVKGTELVVGLGDTIALSFIYAMLLKAGKPHSEILVNQNADLERNKWGINFISIGAANTRTREVLETFENTYFCFDDNFSSIILASPTDEITAPATIEKDRNIEVKYRKKVVLEDGKDYGVILKLRDENSDDNKGIIIVAGLGKDGTAGAAFYLWRHYDKLAEQGDTFGVLIETKAGYESAKMVDFESVAMWRSVK